MRSIQLSQSAIYRYSSTAIEILSGTTLDSGNILGVALDLDSQTVQFYRNGLTVGNLTTLSSSGNTWTPMFRNANQVIDANFGQKPFRYAPPEGFQPLNYANLPSPGVVRPDSVVGVTTYVGDDSSETVNIGFKPDLIVTKCSDSSSYGWRWVDSVRGIDKYLMSHSDAIQGTEANGITSLQQSGYNVGSAQDWNKNG